MSRPRLDRLADVDEPEALLEEVVDVSAGLDPGLASDLVTVQAIRPRAAHSVLLDRMDTPARLLASQLDPAKGLADSRCAAAHTSSAANDQTSSPSARQLGWRQESLYNEHL
jgi:hypothetical protein